MCDLRTAKQWNEQSYTLINLRLCLSCVNMCMAVEARSDLPVHVTTAQKQLCAEELHLGTWD